MSSSRNRNILSAIRRRKSPLALPLEILRRILSHVSDQDTLAVLCRLNEKTLQMAGPLLYKTVEIRSATSFERFFNPVQTAARSSKVAAALDVSQIQTLHLDFDYHPSLERSPLVVGEVGTVPTRLAGLPGSLHLQKLVVVSTPKDSRILNLLFQRVLVHLDPIRFHIHSSTLHESTSTMLVSEPPNGTFDRWISFKSVTFRGLLPVVGASLDTARPLVRGLRPEASSTAIELVVDVRVLSGLDITGTLASTKLLQLGREQSVERLRVVVGSDFERRTVSSELLKLEAEVRSKVSIRTQSLRREFPWELVELVMSCSSPSVLASFCGASFKALQDAGKHLYGRVEIHTVHDFRAFFHHVSTLSPHSRLYPFLATSQVHTLHLNIASSQTLVHDGSPPTFTSNQTPPRLASLPSALPLQHLRISLRETDYADALQVYFGRILRHLNPINFTLELTPNHARHPVLTDIGFAASYSFLDSWTSLESVQLVGIFPHSTRTSPFSHRSRVLSLGSRMKEIPKLKITLDMRTNSDVWESGLTSVGGAFCTTMKELPGKLLGSGLLDVREVGEEAMVVLLGDEEEERLFGEGMEVVGLSGTTRGEKIRVEVDPLE